MNRVDQRYVQPVAQHFWHSERLLLRDASDRRLLWSGELDEEPVEIGPELAAFIMSRPEIVALPSPHMWFAVADLPLAPTTRAPSIN